MTEFKFKKRKHTFELLDRRLVDFFEVTVTYYIAKWGSGYRVKIAERVDGTKSKEFAHIRKEKASKWIVSYHPNTGGEAFQQGGIWKSLNQAVEAAVEDLYKF